MAWTVGAGANNLNKPLHKRIRISRGFHASKYLIKITKAAKHVMIVSSYIQKNT